jgi:hypothetical protein
VKAEVQASQGDAFPADKMMLIFQGKVLQIFMLLLHVVVAKFSHRL